MVKDLDYLNEMFGEYAKYIGSGIARVIENYDPERMLALMEQIQKTAMLTHNPYDVKAVADDLTRA